MLRNLDLTAIRSFVAVADAGGVTRAAGILNLTQSAVSMQLKRLEESLGLALLDRSSRRIGVTPEGEQLLSYARRMLALNDEALHQLTSQDFQGEIVLGVPHDIIHPYIPPVLRKFSAEFPRVQVKFFSDHTLNLREMFDRGEIDVILTTEEQPGPGGAPMLTLPLVWTGATGGNAWKQRPLPVAFCKHCIFRPAILKRLSDAGVGWQMVAETELDEVAQAIVSADMAISAQVKGAFQQGCAPVMHDGSLPDPGQTQIVIYQQSPKEALQVRLHDLLTQSYLSVWSDVKCSV